MQNKKGFITLLFLLSSFFAIAQPTTISPYSKYGPGILRASTFTRNFGMGGVGIGLRSNREIGLINPASYSALAVTTFDAGYTSNALWLSDEAENQQQTSSYIDHIVFGFPIVKNTWGMSFGFLPYSNVGYNYDETIEFPTAGSVNLFENGDGAINKAYFGNGFSINMDTNSQFSFGANAYFLFGAINAEKIAVYGDLPGAYNIIYKSRTSVADFGYDFGMQFKRKIERLDKNALYIVVGATYGLAANLDTKVSDEQFTFSGTDEIVNTSELEELNFSNIDVEGVMQLPSQMGFGASLEKENKWILALDYKTTDWGNIASNSTIFNYQSNYTINLGGQFIPKYDGQHYFQRVAYRVGTRFSNSHLEINKVDWNEYGITFGMGLPVRKSENSYPRINFGFEYGKRGTKESGLIEERFFNLNFGVTINATWFRKRKYD